MKIIIRPIVNPQREVDLTRQLVSAIAEELWRLYGGNEQLNWLEAERHLEGIVAEARTNGRETGLVLVDARAAGAGASSDAPARRRQVGNGADGNGRRNVRVRRRPVLVGTVAVGVTA
jgi:hypothetical protein